MSWKRKLINLEAKRMAKGKLTAIQMFEEKHGEENYINKKDAVKLMRQFAMQETLWWSKLADKWEKAYSELLKNIDG